MCRACEHLYRSCNHLDFSKMRVRERLDRDVRVVVCTDYADRRFKKEETAK
jgi:hypothetical protein